jgi:hypothetical protein
MKNLRRPRNTCAARKTPHPSIPRLRGWRRGWTGCVIPRNTYAAHFKASRSFAAAALAVFAVALLAYDLHGFAAVHSALADFRAFRCAGSTLLHGADPYRAAALSSCEQSPAPLGLYSAPAGLVVPAPLPPYALLLFVPFAYAAFPIAAVLWLLVLCCAVIASALLFARTLRIALPAVCWMLLLSAVLLWLPFGEATPIALLGAALAARALQTQQRVLAAAGFALLALEPHLALGAWLCTFFFAPRMRAAILVTGGALIALSLAVPGALVEYAGSVLPLHALAEVPRPAQYSATWALGAIGVSPHAALQAGSFTYAAAMIGGVWAAARLRQRWNDAAVLVLAPIAAAAIGGTFVHASHIALAVPFAAMLAAREPGRAGRAAALACAVLSVPWLTGAGQQVMLFAGAAVAAVVTLSLTRSRPAAAGMFAGALGCAVMLFALRQAHAVPHPRTFPIAARTGELASASWGRYVWREQSSVTAADWLGKMPTWFALLLLAGAAAAAAHKEAVVVVRVRDAPAAP